MEGRLGVNDKASPPGRLQEQAPKQRCTFSPTTFSSVQFHAFVTLDARGCLAWTSLGIISFLRSLPSKFSSASKKPAFGALSVTATSRPQRGGVVHEALVATVSLHGAECWAMKDSHVRAITSFHRRCARTGPCATSPCAPHGNSTSKPPLLKNALASFQLYNPTTAGCQVGQVQCSECQWTACHAKCSQRGSHIPAPSGPKGTGGRRSTSP